jgi:AraC family transcriptional regulator
LNSAAGVFRRYDAEILTHKTINGSGFRVEVETQDVTGHRAFDVQLSEHTLTLTPDGPPTWVSGRIDGVGLERFAVRPGQVTLLPMGQRFRGHTDGRGVRGELRLSFSPQLVTRASSAEIDGTRLGFVRSLALANPMIRQALTALRREIEQPATMGRVYAESLIVLTLTELVRHHSTLASVARPASHLPSPRLDRIIQYIEAHLGDDLSLLTLAAEAGLSASHLAWGFKRAMGRPVHQYVLARRLESAAALLAGTEQMIAAVALATGFSSQSHLTTAFQHLYGTTPAVYRRQRHS